MSLRLPSELVVEEFLPAMRVALAEELSARGQTQQEIAGELGVTQAAVSKYLGGDVSADERLRDHPRLRSAADRVAEGLATEEMDGYDALAEVLALVEEFEDRGPICELHEEAMPTLRGLGCDLCVRGRADDVTAERRAIRGVERAARRFAAEVPPALVPNVGSNLATALPDATDVTDVAAVPGRLHAMRGRVNVPSRPEFGASEHVAGAVLVAANVDGAVRGAVNVATDEDFLAAAREAGYDPLAFDPEYENRREELRDRFEERGAVPTVAYHRGGFGIEPITYVFGADAGDAVTTVTSLARS